MTEQIKEQRKEYYGVLSFRYKRMLLMLQPMGLTDLAGCELFNSSWVGGDSVVIETPGIMKEKSTFLLSRSNKSLVIQKPIMHSRRVRRFLKVDWYQRAIHLALPG